MGRVGEICIMCSLDAMWPLPQHSQQWVQHPAKSKRQLGKSFDQSNAFKGQKHCWPTINISAEWPHFNDLQSFFDMICWIVFMWR